MGRREREVLAGFGASERSELIRLLDRLLAFLAPERAGRPSRTGPARVTLKRESAG